MQKKLEDIRFNLTESMSKELLKFNNIKRELNEKINLYNLDKNDKLLTEIELLKKELENSRNKFVNLFQKNNKKEILEYINIKKKP